MEGNFLKNHTITAEYRFARDLVAAVIEIRAIYVNNFIISQLDKTFFTVVQRIKIGDIFSKEGPQLEDLIKRYTSGNGRPDYSDKQFLLCVAQFMENYKPELKSEDEFLFVCSRIAYVTACFLKKNAPSDVISVAVDRVYEILFNTFYTTTKTEVKPLFKDTRDRKYHIAYYLIKTLVGMRGVFVPDLELPDSDNLLFTDDHKNKIKELFSTEWSVLDGLTKSFLWEDQKFSYSDETLSRCIDKIVADYGSEQNTEDEFVLVCARVAYAAACCMRENNVSSAAELAVNRIYQMAKNKIHFDKYEGDEDYRFACDLVKSVANMRSNPLAIAEMSHFAHYSFFMIAHRNKIEEFLSNEKSYLNEVVQTFANKDGNMDYNDAQFLQCMDQIAGNYELEYKSKEKLVFICARISYAAACFLRLNKKSNAPGMAIDHMLKIIKDINLLPTSKEEEVLLMHTQDDHYRFAYDLVKTVLELQNVPVCDSDRPDANNFLFTATHRSEIEIFLAKESTRIDEMTDKISNRQGHADYSDSNFLRCMRQIVKEYQHDQERKEEFVYICAKIAYLSACFLKQNFKSNATFLAVNRIYELIKAVNYFSNTTEEQVLILKAQDNHYCFAYNLIKTVFEIIGIPVSPINSPDPDNILLTATDRNEIQEMLTEEWCQLDEMAAKFTSKGGRLDYSDSKFLDCMDHIVQAYQSDQNGEKGYVHVFARIAYTAATFLINNHRSNASFLAANRMYEMSKDSSSKRIEEGWTEEENYDLAYDLLKAALQMSNSIKMETPVSGDSSSMIKDFLAKEWPYLHALVRTFTRRCAGIAFSDFHFLHCVQKIINDYESELTSENGIVRVCARIAYVATCFLRKNKNSNAVDLAVDHVYQMRKKFRQFEEENFFIVDKRDEKHRFAYDLVKTVMELQNTPMNDLELPTPDNPLFTSQHRKKIKKLLRRESSTIDKLVEKLTNIDGNWNYSDGNFLLCMDQIFKDNKYDQVTKDGFVRLCARIAYPASNFVRKNKKSNAITLAVNRIHEMVMDIVYFNKDLEDTRFLEDVKDDKYRFAYDLVKTATELVGLEEQKRKLPNPTNFLFTKQHKDIMIKLFTTEGLELSDLIKMFTYKNRNPDYSDKNFLSCMGYVIEEYKPETYTEEGFILLCSRIAYVAASYLAERCRSHATLLAVNRIHEMVKDVYSRGTLSQSYW
ncbi:hypothetical protein HNY73_009127 [Argiope bruennichi]|uniref:Uncharacterized protein n=1 Tax=Argiope bruennichi TaxID=94029 RepID=A0A8T0F8K7_ARGBR|nr:hypothetical protein HNY73_009127 [Argiope bruennichi]